MIADQGDCRQCCCAWLLVNRDKPLFTGAYRQNGRLRRIDDGIKLLDAKHAEIRDGKRAALKILGLESISLRLSDQAGYLIGDFHQPLRVRRADDGGDQASFEGYGHCHMGVREFS